MTAVHVDGCTPFGDSEATEFENEPLAVTAKGHRIKCDYLILATHVSLAGVTNAVSALLLPTQLYPYSTYVLEAVVPGDRLQPGLYNNTVDPYFYLRIRDEDGQRHAIFGGQDHKTGQADPGECIQRLEQKLLEIFPDAEVHHGWSGQVIETADGLPYIGETAANQFVATGYSGMASPSVRCPQCSPMTPC